MNDEPIYIAVVANLDDDGFSRRRSGDWSAHIGRDRSELIERVTSMAYKYNKESGSTRYKTFIGTLTEEVTLNSVTSARWPKPAPPKAERPAAPSSLVDEDIPF